MDIDIQVDEKGENMLFIVSNNTSEKSAFYHMVDAHERSPGNEAMGNLYQVYIWKEPIAPGFNDFISPGTPQASSSTGISTTPFQ